MCPCTGLAPRLRRPQLRPRSCDLLATVYRDIMSLSNQNVLVSSLRIPGWYTGMMPKLWNETIEAHRAAVRDAILETTWALVAERGLLSVTMSQIAEKAGIGSE